MKKIFYFAALAFLTMGMASCSDDNDNPTPVGGDGVELVTGEYIVKTYMDAEGTTSEDIPLMFSKDGTSYTLEGLFGIGGLPLICTYDNGTVMSTGTFMSQGQVMELFGYYYGLSNEEGELVQAFAIASFLDPQGSAINDPMLINVNTETNTLSEFASNLMLILAPATLGSDGMMQIDEDQAVAAGYVVAGTPLTRSAATTSLSSVRRAPMTLAPVAPVKVNQILR